MTALDPTTGTDCTPDECARELFLAEALDGLSQPRKTLPCKYFYDARGSALFDAITELPEYYPTRTEAAILRASGGEMARAIGPAAHLIEFGSGSSTKTRILLDALIETGHAPAAYTPTDISGEHLAKSAGRLRRDYPGLCVEPVCHDYTNDLHVPPAHGARRKVVFFPGSTIGNFHPEEAEEFLGRIARLIGKGGGLLIGVDLRKDPAILEAAYDDAQGVTADFNLNLLRRLNAELGADFDLEGGWSHRALFNDEASRIEMHLVSQRRQTVRLGAERIAFAEGETIWTESSYKYTLDRFAAIAGKAGLVRKAVWMDKRRWFSLQEFGVGQATT
ncbi:MAG: L-histidine N(alpha)-methyltransferase [Sumerlaeia bacterium]